jgi:hypothetical protein
MDREGLFRHPGDTGSEELIQATAFGGLNTIANSANMPYADAHRLLNVDISNGANLIKRKGTRLVFEQSLNTNGINYNRVVSTAGLNFLIAKIGTSIRILSVNNDELTSLTNFIDVWPNTASEDSVTIISTNEPEQRFIMLGKNTIPVHVKMVERNVIVSSNGATTSVVDNRFSNGVAGATFFAYVNSTLQPSNSLTYDNVTKTATLAQNVVAGDVVTFIYFFWQWWAEAELYNTNRFFDAKTRFSDTAPGRSVTLSAEVQDDCERDAYGLYRIYGSLNSANTDGYFIRSRNPSSELQYKPSDGSLNFVDPNHGTGEEAVDGTSTLLYGNIYNHGEPFLNFATRIRKLSHNGGTGLTPSNIFVQVNNFTKAEQIQRIAGRAQNNGVEYGFLLFNENDWDDPNPNLSALNNPQITPGAGVGTGSANDLTSGQRRFPKVTDSNFTAKASHIAFGNARKRGLPSAALVRIINTDKKWVGNAGLTTNTDYLSGTWFPVYGLGKFANYELGFFPSTGVLYQSRLVLGGFPGRSMDLAVSAISDYSWPGELYNDFTIDAFTTTPNHGFDVVLQGSSSDRIRSMGVYQNSLFVATNDRLYRVFSRNAFTADQFLTQFVGNTGVLNEQCMAVGEHNAFILSKTGVYQIVPSDGLDDSYNLLNLSYKIANLFEIENVKQMRERSSLAFDPTTKKLYASIPRFTDGLRSRLLVFFLDIGAWTEYEAITGLQILDMTQYSDNNGTERFLIVHRRCNNVVQLLRTEYEYPIDFARTVPGNTTPQLCPLMTETFTTTTAARYQHRLVVSALENVEDIVVTLNNRVLSFRTEWAKQLNNTILLLFTPSPGATLTVSYKNPTVRIGSQRVYGYEAVKKNLDSVYRNDGAYTINESTGNLTLSGNAQDTYIVGNVYPTMYASPVFSYGLLKQHKRFYNWSGLFSLRAFDDVYPASTPGDNVDGERKIGTDVNISVVYNNEREGYTEQDLFRLSELLFDFYSFDDLDGNLGRSEYANVSVPLQGVGYSIQAVLWSADDDAWALSAYQVEGRRQTGRRRVTGE